MGSLVKEESEIPMEMRNNLMKFFERHPFWIQDVMFSDKFQCMQTIVIVF